MLWTDLQVIDTRKIATPLTAGGDLSVCPDGPIAVAPLGRQLDPAPYADGVWVSTAAMTETVKVLADDDAVVGTIDRDDLLVVSFPIVAAGGVLREFSTVSSSSDVSPEELLRWLVSSQPDVRRLALDPADT